jgi:hypothetical protein
MNLVIDVLISESTKITDDTPAFTYTNIFSTGPCFDGLSQRYQCHFRFVFNRKNAHPIENRKH